MDEPQKRVDRVEWVLEVLMNPELGRPPMEDILAARQVIRETRVAMEAALWRKEGVFRHPASRRIG